MAWLRLLAVFAAVLVSVLVLRELPPFIVLLVVVSGTWYVASRLRAEQARDRRTGTELLGLRRETVDPFGLVDYPLELFRRSDDAAVMEVSWGAWQHLEVRVFAATASAPGVFVPPDVDGERRRDPPSTSFAGVLTNLAAEAPAVVIEPEVFATLFPRAPSLDRISTGDAAFDAAWSVWTADPSFATRLLDDDVRVWLRSLGDAWGVEISGRIVLVYGRRPEHPDVVGVLEILSGFLRQVPDGLFERGRPAG